MKKFTVIYRVYGLGSIYQGRKVLEAQDKQDAVSIIKQLEPTFVSVVEIKEGV
jgi:hypothetical protein